ncbi:uncharacterized protein LOC114928480 [Nylanderia fulva]|uniref:uncharacterized protein LOC114928480 n=1 Tax=Nylanderia fulva TaxID=613905 RepID=UPI0010FB5DEA|nr:uncharacterized protein LOC114928480 [Nylanderia fulva]
MWMIKSHVNSVKKAVETQVIASMQRQGYTLNAVNNYDENLLHTSAANDCFRIVKEILSQKENCRVIDRKNKFGWTPLMQAIRNRNIDTVTLLLEKGTKIDQVTYLGMSVLGLAAAINKKMFETVYNACPNALANATNDDITPLCVVAMKNDKELFFRLLELGMPLSTDNEYTRLMMKRSTIPEIAALVSEDSVTNDYWNDTSDNIEVIEQNIDGTTRDCKLMKNNENEKRKTKLHLPIFTESDKQDLISPNLTYDIFMLSPNTVCFEKDELTKSNVIFKDKDGSKNITETDCVTIREFESPFIERFKSRSTDDTKNLSCDLNATLGFIPEFSPLKSPNVPSYVNEENAFGENTPTPPRCKTPPKGMLLNWSQTKMIILLRRFGLNQHIPIFLEQETTQTKYPKRIFSGIQPTGNIHLGNYFGAIQRWVELQNAGEEVLCSIVDLHSITLPQDPKKLRENTLVMTATLVACGIDFEKSILFQQSKVPMHTELCWVLSTITTMPRLAHLPQFKEKSESLKNVPLGLYIYPVLQAADILLYKATHVPVGQDQAQHIQLAQDLAQIFNRKFGQTFPIPHTLISDGPSQRIKSLRDPMKKMSKSHPDFKSRLDILDEPDVLLEKIKKAMTDFTSEVTYEPEKRPGVANLINIHSLFTGKTPDEICKEVTELNTGQYKLVLADVVIEKLSPIREDILRLIKDPTYLDEILKKGTERATELATNCWEEVTNKVFGIDTIQEVKNITSTVKIM